MSIATEISRLTTAKSAIKTAIEAKGVSVPSNAKLDVYDDYIANIEGGGGVADVWQPHPDWIDISSVNDNEINLLVSDGGTGVVFSVTTASGTYSIDWGDGTIETGRVSGTTYHHQYVIGSGQSVNGGQYTVFRIRIYGASANITRFQMQKNPNYSRTHYSPLLWAVLGTRYITTYANTFYGAGLVECREMQSCTIPSFESCNTAASMFSYCYSLSSVVLPTTWGILTDASNMFSFCYSLSSITLPSSWGSVTAINAMFKNCSKLSSITLPSSWGSINNIGSLFYGCYSLSSITMPSSWGMITNTGSAFYGCVALSSLTLPSSMGSITVATSMFAGCNALRQCSNLQYLGSNVSACDMATFLQDAQALTGSVTIASRLSKIGTIGASGYLLKLTELRLTNTASTFAGTSPQIDVQYCSLALAALELLFGDIPYGLSTKTIRITGSVGADTIITKATSGTTAGSAVVTQANTSSLAIGMEVTGTGIDTTRAVTFQDTGDTVTLAGHGIPNGKQVAFTVITTTTGITINRIYYVVNATTDTFQVSLTQGGAAVALTTNGTGTLKYIPVVTAITTNVNFTLDIPCSATGSITASFGVLKRSIAILKGWTVTG